MDFSVFKQCIDKIPKNVLISFGGYSDICLHPEATKMILYAFDSGHKVSIFSTLVGMHIPGTGAIYKSQTLEFLRPVFIGDTLYAWFEIIDIDPDSEEIVIKSWIENQDGKNVIEGKTVASLLRGLKK